MAEKRPHTGNGENTEKAVERLAGVLDTLEQDLRSAQSVIERLGSIEAEEERLRETTDAERKLDAIGNRIAQVKAQAGTLPKRATDHLELRIAEAIAPKTEELRDAVDRAWAGSHAWKNKDFYGVLGLDRKEMQRLSPEQFDAEVQKAHRKKSGEYHPDRGGSEEDMVRINEAKEVLADADLREQFEKVQNIKERPVGSRQAPRSAPESGQAEQQPRPQRDDGSAREERPRRPSRGAQQASADESLAARGGMQTYRIRSQNVTFGARAARRDKSPKTLHFASAQGEAHQSYPDPVAVTPAKLKGKKKRAPRMPKPITTHEGAARGASKRELESASRGAKKVERETSAELTPDAVLRGVLADYKNLKRDEIEREIAAGREQRFPDRAYWRYARDASDGAPIENMPERVRGFLAYLAERAGMTSQETSAPAMRPPEDAADALRQRIARVSGQLRAARAAGDAVSVRMHEETLRGLNAELDAVARRDRSGDLVLENRVDVQPQGDRARILTEAEQARYAEMARQLREQAGGRRMEGADLGLTPEGRPMTKEEIEQESETRSFKESLGVTQDGKVRSEEAAILAARERGLAAPEARALERMAAADVGLTQEGRMAASLDAAIRPRAEARRSGASPQEREMLSGFAARWRAIPWYTKVAVGVGLFGIGVAGAATGGWLGATVAGIAYAGGRTMSGVGVFAAVDGLTGRMGNRRFARTLSIGAGVAAFLAVPAIAQYLNAEFGLGQKIRNFLGWGEPVGPGKQPGATEAKIPESKGGPGVPDSKGGEHFKPAPEAPAPDIRTELPSHPVSVAQGDGPSVLIERALQAQGISRPDQLKMIYHLQGKLISVDLNADPQGRVWKIIASPAELAKWKIDPAMLEGLKDGSSIGKNFDISGMLSDPAVRDSLPKGVRIAPEYYAPAPAAESIPRAPQAPDTGPSAPENADNASQERVSQAELSQDPIAAQESFDQAMRESAPGELSPEEKATLEREISRQADIAMREDIRAVFGSRGFFGIFGGGDATGIERFRLHDWRTVGGVLNAESLPRLSGNELERVKDYFATAQTELGLNLKNLKVEDAMREIAKIKIKQELGV